MQNSPRVHTYRSSSCESTFRLHSDFNFVIKMRQSYGSYKCMKQMLPPWGLHSEWRPLSSNTQNANINLHAVSHPYLHMSDVRVGKGGAPLEPCHKWFGGTTSRRLSTIWPYVLKSWNNGATLRLAQLTLPSHNLVIHKVAAPCSMHSRACQLLILLSTQSAFGTRK